MPITPIETRYASHRFRSRLEARWAVFFDTLGIKWEYEPQGYLVGHSKRPYLPDFRLPDLKAFVEVKGDPENLDINLLADFTEEKADARDPHNFLILGQIPTMKTGAVPTHTMLTPAIDTRTSACVPPLNMYIKASAVIDTLNDEDRQAIWELHAWYRRITVVCQRFVFLTNKTGPFYLPINSPEAWSPPARALASEAIWPVIPMTKVAAAYEAARSARFEHGEFGPPPA